MAMAPPTGLQGGVMSVLMAPCFCLAGLGVSRAESCCLPNLQTPCLGQGLCPAMQERAPQHSQGSSPGLAHRTASPCASHTPPPAPSWFTHWPRGPLTVPHSHGGHGARGPGFSSAWAAGVTPWMPLPSACALRGKLRPALAVCACALCRSVPHPPDAPAPWAHPPSGAAAAGSVPGPVHWVVQATQGCPSGSSAPAFTVSPHICKSRPCSGLLTGCASGQPSPWGARGCLCEGLWVPCGLAGWGHGHPALPWTMWQPWPG